jgi:5'(3')-deoxyribonucleotidase
MMRKPLVLVDCDGPMADFCEGFLDLIEEETGERFGAACITEWTITDSPFFQAIQTRNGQTHAELARAVWKRANRIGFCSSLKPVAGAIEAVERLREFANVEVLTSPLASSPTWITERVEWLGRHFGFEAEDVHLVSKKFRVPGDFLIDDKLSHLLKWRSAEGRGGYTSHAYQHVPILWDAPYNRERGEGVNVKRANSWEEVITLVKGEILSFRYLRR